MSYATGQRMEAYTELEVTQCWCGIPVAVPANLLRNVKDTGGSVYCPIGHEFHWKARNERKKLQEQLQREREHSGRLAAERDQIEASRRAQKGATTRARKRHAAGVCPACKRTFQNVQRHMESQHPDYDPEKGHHGGS